MGTQDNVWSHDMFPWSRDVFLIRQLVILTTGNAIRTPHVINSEYTEINDVTALLGHWSMTTILRTRIRNNGEILFCINYYRRTKTQRTVTSQNNHIWFK